ncbi:V-type ATP synthase subunit D [bacterium Unc6]|nr:V-type ATP synthase subunit D [bacterium Unc6]
MKLTVNPNRMELLRIKKRTILAKKGHKLLKDKQEELMKMFILTIKAAKKLRIELDAQLKEAQFAFLLARSKMTQEELHSALAFPKGSITVDVSVQNVLNIKVPVFKISGRIDPYSYGFAHTGVYLDKAVGLVCGLWSSMIKLAEIETKVELLAKEIEKTRRRVNALEYVLIPSLLETTRGITIKLSEDERSNLTRLMRVKEIIESRY